MTSWLKMALIGATIIMLAAGSSMAATITVHEPDGEGRVFVDVIGPIDKDDFKTFKDKTDQLYPTAFGHSKMQVIVTLVSYGGSASPAWQIGDWIRKRGMSTFVPGDRTCTSACALIWLAGVPRMVGDTPQIGFHAVYDPTTRRETGPGNAVVGAYLRDLGIGYKAIVVMTRKGPTAVEWLSPDLAKELGVAWSMLQSPRAIPLPLQPKLQPRLQPPPQVIAAWSQSARSHRDSERKAAEAEQQRLKEEEVQRQKAAADADARRRTAEAEQQRLRDELQRQIKALFEIRPNMEARPLSSVAFKLIVVSVDECQQKCAELTDCKVFSFSKASNICYSYSDAEFAPNAAFDSGVRQFAAPTAARPKITHRIEPGPQQAPATPAPGAVPGTGAAQKVVLYEEDPADPNGKRFVGSAIWRTETVTPGPGQPPELADSCRRRGAGAQAGDDLLVPPQHRQGPAGHPYRRGHVQAAGGFPGGRHFQRSRHPDEAGGVDPRRAACRSRGEGHARLLPGRTVQPGGRQGAQPATAEGAGLVRHSGGL